jgi:hypothetical protein
MAIGAIGEFGLYKGINGAGIPLIPSQQKNIFLSRQKNQGLPTVHFRTSFRFSD